MKQCRISADDQLYLYTYKIRVLSVKMKVKFQCKMKLQFQSEALTTEVPISEGSVFQFNQDCHLSNKGIEEDFLPISISLITNKGAKYIAGIANIYLHELARAVDTGPSSKIVFSLTKCLDPDAVLEIVVKQSIKTMRAKNSPTFRQQTKSKVNRQQNIYSCIEGQSCKYDGSPQLSPRGHRQYGSMHYATKSQVNLVHGIASRRHDIDLSRVDTIHKGRSRSRKISSKQKDKLSIVSRGSLNHNSFGFPLTQRGKESIEFGNESNFDNYKKSYSKLKEKFKKQEQQSQISYEKRINLQAETGNRIQSLKYRMKCEQLQKNVNDKSQKIRNLEFRIQELQRLLRGESFQQRNYNKFIHVSTFAPRGNLEQKTIVPQNDHLISVLQSKVNSANKELEQFKNKVIKINRTHNQKESGLVKQLQSKNERIRRLEEELNNKNLASRNDENLKFTLQSKQKIISQYEKEQQQLMKKIYQAEKIKRELDYKISQNAAKIEEFQKASNNFILERQKLAQQIEKEKGKTSMAEFTIGNLKKNLQKAENEIQDFKKFKQKYHDAVVEIKKLEGERKLEIKHYENVNKISANNLLMLQSKHKDQTEKLHKKNLQLQAKNRELSFKIKQLENYANVSVKLEMENMRKANDKLKRDCEQFKSLEKMSKKQYSNLEGRINQFNSEIQMWKNKYRSQQNISKLENERFTNEINRLKACLEQQYMSQSSTKQKLQSASTQLAINSNKMLNIEQKYTKQIRELSMKIQLEISKSNKLQQLLKKQEQINEEVRDKEKQLISKIQQYGQNQNQYSGLMKRYESQLSRFKNLLAINEEKLQQKIDTSEDLAKQLKQVSEKYSALMSKDQQLTYEYRRCSSQLQKQLKEKQKLELEFANMRISNQTKQKLIEKQKQIIQQQTKERTQTKEQLLQIVSKHQSLSKQYDRFRQQLSDILIRQFGIDGSHKYSMSDLKIKGYNSIYKEPLTKNTTEGDLFNIGTSRRQFIGKQGQENKITKSVYALHNSSPKHISYGSVVSFDEGTNNDIINSCFVFSRESKSIIQKLEEQYRLLQKDIEYLKQGWLQKQNLYNQDLKRFENTIRELQEQISNLFQQKQLISNRLKEEVSLFKQENLKLKKELERLMEKLQESNFVNNGIRMQKQNEKQYFEMKINQQSGTILKLQYSISNMTTHNIRIENDLKKMEQLKEQTERQLKKYQQEHSFKQKRIKQLQVEKGALLKYNDQINLKIKEHISKLSQLELLLSSEREKNNKNKQLISSEEKKLMDSKDFVNNLIKQKEIIVKQQIQNGKKIIELESIKFNLQHQLQLQKQKMDLKIAELVSQKQKSKKASEHLKQLQLENSNINAMRLKLSQQIKEKDRELAILSQNIKSREAKIERELSQRAQQLNQINNNRELMQKINNQQIENLKKQIKGQQQQISELKQEIKNLSNIKVSSEVQIENLNRKIQESNYEINSYKEIQQRLVGSRDRSEQQLIKTTEELRSKEEQLYTVTGQIHSLEQKYKKRVLQLQQENQNLIEQYDYKFDNMCEDYQTKIDEMERQIDYLKKKIEIAQQQINKGQIKIRELQNDESRERQLNKDVISKIEEEKSHTMNGLKSENKRIHDLKEKLELQCKRKQAQVQRLKLIELSSKNLIYKLEQKLKESQNKTQQIQNLLNEQSQNEKKRQVFIKQYEESIKNYQWSLERQIKKELQNLIKSIISIVSENSQTKRKITEFVKQLENKISRVVIDKISPLPAFSRIQI